MPSLKYLCLQRNRLGDDGMAALASALELREAWKQRGLVEFAYFAGSLFYTFGSYLGFFQVINLGRGAVLTRRRSRTPLPQPCR